MRQAFANIFWKGSKRSPQPTKSEYEIEASVSDETFETEIFFSLGTKNFMRGVPTWATLIALVQVDAAGNEEVVVGIASAPALARRWAAAKGHGATVRFNSGNSDFEGGDTSGDDFAYSDSRTMMSRAAISHTASDGSIATSTAGQSGPFGGSGVSTNGLLHNAVITGLNP